MKYAHINKAVFRSLPRPFGAAVNILLVGLLLPLFCVFSGCGNKGCIDPQACNFDSDAKKDDNSCEYSSCSFNQLEMLAHVGSDIIVAGYTQLEQDIIALEAQRVTFATDPTTSNLAALQAAHKTAWLQWHNVSTYEFGPAADVALRSQTNTFPVDTSQVWNNVQQGGYNLETAANLDAKGFPALDYLLNGLGANNTAIAQQYATGTNSAALLNYLAAVIANLQSKVAGVHSAWTSSYRITFSENEGTNAGSSVALLVNQLSQDLELLKNAQLGIPLGKTLAGTLPDRCEALYAGYSIELAVAHLEALENLYLGRTADGTNGQGFDDYLQKLGSTYGDGLLDDEIQRQFNAAQTALAAVPDPYSETVTNNPAPANAAYEQIQLLLVLLKSDVPSALGVLITYQDNDGD